MAQEAMRTIRAVLAKEMSISQLIALCEEAEQRWPGVKWAEAADMLRERLEYVKRRGFVYHMGYWVNPEYLPDYARRISQAKRYELADEHRQVRDRMREMEAPEEVPF